MLSELLVSTAISGKKRGFTMIGAYILLVVLAVLAWNFMPY